MRICLCTLIAVTMCSCASYRVYQTEEHGRNEVPILGNQPGKEWEFDTKHSLAWGGVRQDTVAKDCEPISGVGSRYNIEETYVGSNFWQGLVSIITLGFWQPVTVGYRCAKSPPPSGVLN